MTGCRQSLYYYRHSGSSVNRIIHCRYQKIIETERCNSTTDLLSEEANEILYNRFVHIL